MLTEHEDCLLYIRLEVTPECSGASTQEEIFQDGKYIFIILRELGGGHGEMNVPRSSEELQTAPGEDFV